MASTLTGLAGATLLATAMIAGTISPAFAGTWKGYVVDQSCSQSYKDDFKAIKTHSRLCALAAPCKAAGYAIYSDKKWLSLDKNGNTLAERALRASKTSQGFYATVEGDLDGSTIKVKSLAETAEAAK